MFARSSMIATVAVLLGAVVWLALQFNEQSQRISVLEREVSITEQIARYAESGEINAQSVAREASVKANLAEETGAELAPLSPDIAPRRSRIASDDTGLTQVDSVDSPQSGFGGAQRDWFGRQSDLKSAQSGSGWHKHRAANQFDINSSF